MRLGIRLPEPDGCQILQTPRSDAKLRNAAVRALSADATPHDVQRGLGAGFDHNLAKPVDLSALLDALDDAMRECNGRPPPI